MVLLGPVWKAPCGVCGAYTRAMGDAVVRRAWVFSGRVQGVGFRARARGIASRPPLAGRVTGWVRNEPDGTVRLEAQGDAGDLEGLLAAVLAEMGPLVSGAREVPAEPVPGESAFTIAR